MEYIKITVGRYVKREDELLKERARLFADNPFHVGQETDVLYAEIDAVNAEIDELQEQINDGIEQSRLLMRDIYEGNSRLSECETIAERFVALRSQYQSDVERLMFIVDGNAVHADLPKREHCPFCDSELLAEDSIPYADTVRADLKHIRVHLTELEKAEQDLAQEQARLKADVETLEEQKRAIDAEISANLTPRLTTLKDKLQWFRYVVEINKELAVIQREERSFGDDLLDKETEEEPTETRRDINQFFDPETVRAFQGKLVEILQVCHYQGAGSARLNMETFDLEIGGREKANSNGGGYCGFLNTIVALAMIEFLEEQGAYSPGFLIVDSPLIQLSESEYKDRSDTLISGFLDYLFGIYRTDAGSPRTSAEQIIIIEHKEKVPMLFDKLADAPHVNVIEFTKDKSHGRDGFLDGVYQYD